MLLLADSVIVHASLYAEAYVVLCKLSMRETFSETVPSLMFYRVLNSSLISPLTKGSLKSISSHGI